MALLSERKQLKTATSREFSPVLSVIPSKGTSNRNSKNMVLRGQNQGQDDAAAVFFSTISGGMPPLEA